MSAKTTNAISIAVPFRGRLYDHRAVALATMIGSPVAGSLLMGLNYVRLAKPGRAAAVIAGGIGLTLFMGLTGASAADVFDFRIAILGFFITVLGARILQRREIKRHLQSGGAVGSKWDALALGLASLLVIGAVSLLA